MKRVILLQRIKLTLAYDGTYFSGYQIQPNKRTVQGELQKALEKMHKKNIKVYASGRTDTGVHALGQVVHFDTNLHIEPNNWQKALNTLLPNDIAIQNVEKVSEHFHARFDAVEKEYHYKILFTEVADVFQRNYMYQIKQKLDVEAIQQATKYFIGTRDFTSFSSPRSTVKGSKVRTLTELSFTQDGSKYIFKLRGNGFLYQMVRIIVGTLLEIGWGKRQAEEIPSILASKDRFQAGKTAPPEGLYLYEVMYK